MTNNKEVEEKLKPELYISYPPTRKRELPKGRITFNWRDGTVSLPGGESEPLSGKLPFDRTLKSLLIFTEAWMEADILGLENVYYRFAVFPTEFAIPHIDFSYTSIETYRVTTAYFIASTNPEGPTHVPAGFYEGKPYIKEAMVSTAGKPVVLNVRKFLGSNAHTGTIENRSGAETLYVYLSDDGETYTEKIPIEAAQGLNLENEDVALIKIDASADNTPYFVFAH